MDSPSDRSAILRLSPEQLSRLELLAGLESWVHLSLLSNGQVVEFCQEYLVCPVASRAIAEPIVEKIIASAASILEPVGAAPSNFAEDFADAHDRPAPSPPRVLVSPTYPPNRFTRSLRSFMAEVSIIWLLILGVFMVVVSSGVLAATQWQNFSAIGQYGILLAYTIAFAVASLWTARQTRLRLTSRMLQLATLLIIPVNFWMMDGLRVGASFVGVVVCAIAALSLTAILLRLLHPLTGLTSGDRFRLIAVNSIGLSWLHWGWGWAGVPLVATYLGTVGTAVLLWKQSRLAQSQLTQSQLVQFQQSVKAGTAEAETAEAAYSESSASPSDMPITNVPVTNVPITNVPVTNASVATAPGQDSLPNVVIMLATLLLMGRAVLAAQVPIDQFGLALGICGWVLGWLNRQEQTRRWAGSGLLLLGWLVSISAEPPWQAIAISGLVLWLLIERMQTQLKLARSSLPTVAAIFGVGLQTYALLGRMVPEGFRQQIVEWAIQLGGDRGMPEALLGVVGFPYILLTLGVAMRLRRRLVSGAAGANFVRSSHQAEALALILGCCLTLVSWENLLWRSLNLTVSALTLFLVCRQRRSPLPILYLTHITVLAGILCWIKLLFPGLSDLANARILLGGMAIEWSLSRGTQRWQRSAWHLGLILATWGYLGLFLNSSSAYENLVGLLIPLGLTGLAYSSRFPSRRLAAWLSAATLIAQLFLLNMLNAWLLSLGIATVLMLLNTYLLRRRFAAFLTVGFALSFEAVAIALQDQVTEAVLVNLLAANLWMLWLLRDGLLRDGLLQRSQRQTESPALPGIYAFAVNIWAIVLCVFTLLSLTVLCVFEPTWGIATATGLTIGAIAYRIAQQPTNLGFGGMAWGTEILAIALVQLSQGGVMAAAIVTLSLGLVTQLAGDIWVRRSNQPYCLSWHLIPLGYAGLGWLMGHTGFTATTGLYTLATALISVGVGRRSPRLKSFSFLSVLLVSGAAYELLIYQMLQAKGGDAGDGVILLAGLAALIAIANRLLSRWLVPYLRLAPSELQSIAHLHWAIGSGLALLAIPFSLSNQGAVLGLGTVGALAGYALAMGRGTQANASESSTAQGWTYAGIWEAIAALSYMFYRWVPELTGWSGAIASLLAVGLYFLPWQRGGWAVRPWQTTALVLPGTAILLTSGNVVLQSLLVTAAFYAWLAQSTRQIRLSYLSLLLLDWALLRYLTQQGWLTSLGYSVILGGSLLYIAQVEPELQTVSARQQRHWMRSIATGLISLTVYYQAEIETGSTAWVMGGLALGLGLGFVFLGIILRVRAFLYMGTAAFMLRILRLFWLFIYSYSTLLWAAGIVLGLLLIWTAATFEARRSQMNSLLQYWMTELASWE